MVDNTEISWHILYVIALNFILSVINNSTMAHTDSQDDSFQLYDLRVEVVCPPGKRIMCGAKEGDFFTLQGEMIYLPPNQGISIYSLGKTPFCASFLYIRICVYIKNPRR